MSIFTKALSQLTIADLQELVQERAIENIRLEFKLEVPNKEDTLKKISSFANTFGGFMVVGARASSTDGRIEDLPGVDVQAGYKQKVVQWCFDGASPPLTVEVSDPIPVSSGKEVVCYVIFTPESDLAPHFLNGRKGVWVRTDEFSSRFEARLAEEKEIRHLLDRRELIRDRRARIMKRARERFETYNKRGPWRPLPLPLLDFCVVPRFPARPICEQGMLKPLVTHSSMSWRGIMFPNIGGGVISQQESAIVLDGIRGSMFEASIWGMLFYGTKIADADNPSKTWGIHLYGFVGHILLFIRHTNEMLRSLGFSGPIYVETVLWWILKVPWLYALFGGIGTKAGSELDDIVTVSIDSTSEALREKPDAAAADILRSILFSVNCPDLVDSPEKVEELIRAGYNYNSWPQPNTLRI